MKVKMSQDEKTSAPEFYLKHKDYFDEKLITVLDDTNNKYLKEKAAKRRQKRNGVS